MEQPDWPYCPVLTYGAAHGILRRESLYCYRLHHPWMEKWAACPFFQLGIPIPIGVLGEVHQLSRLSTLKTVNELFTTTKGLVYEISSIVLSNLLSSS